MATVQNTTDIIFNIYILLEFYMNVSIGTYKESLKNNYIMTFAVIHLYHLPFLL